MKSLSPWFHTAKLLNGIRKTVSRMEATRAADLSEDRRSARFDRSSHALSDRRQHRG